jgi:hypothetical protein
LIESDMTSLLDDGQAGRALHHSIIAETHFGRDSVCP